MLRPPQSSSPARIFRTRGTTLGSEHIPMRRCERAWRDGTLSGPMVPADLNRERLSAEHAPTFPGRTQVHYASRHVCCRWTARTGVLTSDDTVIAVADLVPDTRRHDRTDRTVAGAPGAPGRGRSACPSTRSSSPRHRCRSAPEAGVQVDPAVAHKVNWECELAIVNGKPGRDLPMPRRPSRNSANVAQLASA